MHITLKHASYVFKQIIFAKNFNFEKYINQNNLKNQTKNFCERIDYFFNYHLLIILIMFTPPRRLLCGSPQLIRKYKTKTGKSKINKESFITNKKIKN